MNHKIMVQNLYKPGLVNVSTPQETRKFNTPHLYTTDAHLVTIQ